MSFFELSNTAGQGNDISGHFWRRVLRSFVDKLFAEQRSEWSLTFFQHEDDLKFAVPAPGTEFQISATRGMLKLEIPTRLAQEILTVTGLEFYTVTGALQNFVGSRDYSMLVIDCGGGCSVTLWHQGRNEQKYFKAAVRGNFSTIKEIAPKK